MQKLDSYTDAEQAAKEQDSDWAVFLRRYIKRTVFYGVLMLGIVILGDAVLLPLLRDGLDQYRTVSGDERVYLLKLPEARGDTIGARQHPGAAAHRAAANCLAEFLRSVL